LGHFLLTQLLLDNIIKNKGRIINVSSRAHTRVDKFDLDAITTDNSNRTESSLYCQSKLANVMYTRELQKRYGDKGIISYSLHPGVVWTELGRHFNPTLLAIVGPVMPYVLKNSVEGAQTSVFAALCDPKEIPPGSYLSDCDVAPEHLLATVDCLRDELWEASLKAVGLKT